MPGGGDAARSIHCRLPDRCAKVPKDLPLTKDGRPAAPTPNFTRYGNFRAPESDSLTGYLP